MTLEEFILEADRRGFRIWNIGEHHDFRPIQSRPLGWEALEGWRVHLIHRVEYDIHAIAYGPDPHLAFQRALDEIEPATQRMLEYKAHRRIYSPRPLPKVPRDAPVPRRPPTLDDLFS